MRKGGILAGYLFARIGPKANIKKEIKGENKKSETKKGLFFINSYYFYFDIIIFLHTLISYI